MLMGRIGNIVATQSGSQFAISEIVNVVSAADGETPVSVLRQIGTMTPDYCNAQIVAAQAMQAQYQSYLDAIEALKNTEGYAVPEQELPE